LIVTLSRVRNKSERTLFICYACVTVVQFLCRLTLFGMRWNYFHVFLDQFSLPTRTKSMIPTTNTSARSCRYRKPCERTA